MIEIGRGRMKQVILALLLGLVSSTALAGESIPVFVSIAPQKYFVQQIGADLVDVRIMVPPGAAPHTYEPRPQQMVAMAGAKLYFAIGVAFEKAWLARMAAANPRLKVVHTDRGIAKIPMQAHDHHGGNGVYHTAKDGQHGKGIPPTEDRLERQGHQHAKEGRDPHIWLSPPLVKIQAGTILEALQESDPAHQNEYQANYHRFVSEIETLHAELKTSLAGKQKLQFMVFHPSWGYFAAAYDLEQVPVELEGKDPKPAQLQALIAHARQKGLRVIFVQPQFSRKRAALVAREINGQLVIADPLAEDWPANLRAMAAQLTTALR